MVDRSTGNPEPGRSSGQAKKGIFWGRDFWPNEERFPPEHSIMELIYLAVADFCFLGGIVFAVDQLMIGVFSTLQNSTSWAYIGFGVALFGLVADRYLRHDVAVHKARVQDQSEIRAWIIEANNIIQDDDSKAQTAPTRLKSEQVAAEVNRLDILGPYGWTEYQVLSLFQMLVDFLDVDRLKARAKSNLAVLDDYAGDSAFRYDYALFYKWEERIEGAIQAIDQAKDQSNSNGPAVQRLKAELKELLEHVADYNASWGEGSAIIRDLIIGGTIGAIFSLIMGLIPVLHPAGEATLGLLHWGFLGVCGSLTALLRYFYKSNRVEVGNTEGKNELWRAVIGSTLGFVAGVVIYSIIAGELLSGNAVPNPDFSLPMDIALSVVWALGSGMFFEGVYERLRSSVN